MFKMKKIMLLLIASIIVSSLLLVGVSAQPSDQAINLSDEAQGSAPGYMGGGEVVLTWANNSGMKFQVLTDEVLTGVTFRTIIAGKNIKASLYKWNSSLHDKDLLEEKDLTSVDWQQVIFDFDKAYPQGTYYVEVETLAGQGNAPYLYAMKKVITGRNIAAYQYDKTWAELGIKEGKDFGEGFDMSIKTIKGVSSKAQSFLILYNRTKSDIAEGAQIHDQAQYDIVKNAVGNDIKNVIRTANDTTFQQYIDALTNAMANPGGNPPTGDSKHEVYFIIALASIVLVVSTTIIVKRAKDDY